MARRRRRFRVGYNRNFNIGRTIGKIGTTILSLWVGGYFITELGIAMLGSCSPFFKGLTIIGWDVGNNATATGASTQLTFVGASVQGGCETSSLIIYDTTDAGVLTVVGLVGIASVVMEFVKFRLG